MFDDSDGEGEGEYKPQAESTEEQTAPVEPAEEPPKEAEKPALFDDDDGGEEYVP